MVEVTVKDKTGMFAIGIPPADAWHDEGSSPASSIYSAGTSTSVIREPYKPPVGATNMMS